MSLLSKHASAYTLTTGFNGNFTNPANAYANDTNYATEQSTGRNTEFATNWRGFDFSSIPAGSTINSVDVYILCKISAANSKGEWRSSVWEDVTASAALTSGTSGALNGEVQQTLAATNTTEAYWHYALGTLPTLAQLQATNFGIRVQISRGNTTTAYIHSINDIYIAVDYTEGAVTRNVTTSNNISFSTANATLSNKIEVAIANPLVLSTSSILSDIILASTSIDLIISTSGVLSDTLQVSTSNDIVFDASAVEINIQSTAIQVTCPNNIIFSTAGLLNIQPVVETYVVDTGGTGDYTSLYAAELALRQDLVTNNKAIVILCKASTGVADTTAVTFQIGWTTDDTHTITVKNHPDEPVDMVWNTSRYRLFNSVANASCVTAYVTGITFDGIQVRNEDTVGAGRCFTWNGSTFSGKITIKNCHISGYGVLNGYNYYIYLNTYGSVPATHLYIYIVNNVIIGRYQEDTTNVKNGGAYISMYAGSAAYTDVYYYNNTFYSLLRGIAPDSSADVTTHVYNNIFAKCANNLTSSPVDYDYNVTSLSSTVGIGANGKVSQTFTFVSEDATDNYKSDLKLQSTDTGAIDSGTSLASDDGYAFTTDALGTARSGTWDCGFFEYVATGGTTVYVNTSNTVNFSTIGNILNKKNTNISDSISFNITSTLTRKVIVSLNVSAVFTTSANMYVKIGITNLITVAVNTVSLLNVKRAISGTSVIQFSTAPPLLYVIKGATALAGVLFQSMAVVSRLVNFTTSDNIAFNTTAILSTTAGQQVDTINVVTFSTSGTLSNKVGITATNNVSVSTTGTLCNNIEISASSNISFNTIGILINKSGVNVSSSVLFTASAIVSKVVFVNEVNDVVFNTVANIYGKVSTNTSHNLAFTTAGKLIVLRLVSVQPEIIFSTGSTALYILKNNSAGNNLSFSAVASLGLLTNVDVSNNILFITQNATLSTGGASASILVSFNTNAALSRKVNKITSNDLSFNTIASVSRKVFADEINSIDLNTTANIFVRILVDTTQNITFTASGSFSVLRSVTSYSNISSFIEDVPLYVIKHTSTSNDSSVSISADLGLFVSADVSSNIEFVTSNASLSISGISANISIEFNTDAVLSKKINSDAVNVVVFNTIGLLNVSEFVVEVLNLTSSIPLEIIADSKMYLNLDIVGNYIPIENINISQIDLLPIIYGNNLPLEIIVSSKIKD